MATEADKSGSAQSHPWRNNLLIPAVLFVLTVVSGSLGTYQYLASLSAYQGTPTPEIIFDSLFTSLGFLIMNSGPYPATEGVTPVLVYIGRGTGIIFFSYAAILAFSTLFAEQLKPLRISWWHLRSQLHLGGAADHIVVCGVGHKGFKLASALLEEDQNVVVIEENRDSTRAAELSDRGAVVLYGDATRRQTIGQRAKGHLASEIFVNCGSDRTNTKVVQTAGNWLNEQRADDSGLTDYVVCRAHIRARRRRYFIHEQLHGLPHLQLHTYDTDTATARELLQRHPVDRFETLPTETRTHVVLIGWSDLTRALVFELCQTMHYLDECDRTITVVCQNPDAAQQELYEHYPALDPTHWNQEAIQSFVADIFPTLSFLHLPRNDDLLLSNQFELYDRLQPKDRLTMIVADEDGARSDSLTATIVPRMEAIEREMGLNTSILYIGEAASESARSHDYNYSIESDVIDIYSFSEFVDECTPATVRGEHRDQVAKQMALFFHLRYEYEPTATYPTVVDETLAQYIPFDPPTDNGYNYETAIELWDQLSDARIDTLADLVWQQLTETNRDANRHAADHVPVKQRLESVLSTNMDRETIVKRLAATEHQRWCAEKFLNGWEPLPEENIPEWQADESEEERFREQKYHIDIRPADTLESITDGEVKKDFTLVRFVLNHIHSQ